MGAIIEFLKDSAKALADIIKFFKAAFEFIINFVGMIPSPFREILLLMIAIISAIIIYKLVRGS